MYDRLDDNKKYTKEEIFTAWGVSNSKLREIVLSLGIKPARLGKINLYRGKDLNIYYDKLFINYNDRSPFDKLKT